MPLNSILKVWCLLSAAFTRISVHTICLGICRIVMSSFSGSVSQYNPFTFHPVAVHGIIVNVKPILVELLCGTIVLSWLSLGLLLWAYSISPLNRQLKVLSPKNCHPGWFEPSSSVCLTNLKVGLITFGRFGAMGLYMYIYSFAVASLWPVHQSAARIALIVRTSLLSLFDDTVWIVGAIMLSCTYQHVWTWCWLSAGCVWRIWGHYNISSQLRVFYPLYW